jgi:Flp pilus assembly protein TadD
MFQKASELNGSDFRVWMNLGIARRWIGQDAGALDAYARALPLLEEMAKRQPEDPGTQSALGGVYARFQQRDKAAPRLEAALALAPKDPVVLERAAGAHEVLGDRAQAIEFTTRALQAGAALEDLKSNPELRGVLADPGFKPPTNLKNK